MTEFIIRDLDRSDWTSVREIFEEGIATGHAWAEARRRPPTLHAPDDAFHARRKAGGWFPAIPHPFECSLPGVLPSADIPLK
jgi:L-amino acid N-acyltransferase YncA